MAASSNKRRRDDDSLLVFDSSHFFLNLLTDDDKPHFSDLKILCGDKTFDVQRSVLASVSPVLKHLFIRNQENSPGKPLELPKEFVTKESFALVLDLIYKGQITIDGDNVLRLHSAGNYLEIDQVVNKCAEFISKGLNIDSVISVWQYACTLTVSANRLLKEAVRFAGENFSKLVKHDTILALKKGELCLLLSQLTNDDDENLVLEATLEWLGHDWKARFRDCEEVLSRVLWQFVDHTRCLELKSVEAIEALIDQKSLEEVATMKMLLMKVFPAGGGESSADKSDATIYCLTLQNNGFWTFRKLFPSQKKLNRAPIVSKTEQLIQNVKGYIFKGFFTFQGRLMAVLSHEEDEHFEQGFMLAGVSDNGEPKLVAQLEVLETQVSYDEVKITSHDLLISIFLYKTSEKHFFLHSTYDLRNFGRRIVYDEDELFVVPVLSRAVDAQFTERISSHSTLSFATEIYFFGVSQTNTYTNAVDVDVFHVASQKWSKLPCLQAARRYPTANVIGGSFFVVGGHSGKSSVSNAVEMMSIDDPSTWKQLPGLKYARYLCRLISCGQFLVVFGGGDGDGAPVLKAEILDLLNLAKGWEEYPPLHGVCPKFVVKA